MVGLATIRWPRIQKNFAFESPWKIAFPPMFNEFNETIRNRMKYVLILACGLCDCYAQH